MFDGVQVLNWKPKPWLFGYLYENNLIFIKYILMISAE